jgi:hypothetical protein
VNRTAHGADERALASVTVVDGVGLDAPRNADSKAHLWAAVDVIDM